MKGKILFFLGLVVFFGGFYLTAHAAPPAPTVTANPVSSCAVQLNWNEPTPPAGVTVDSFNFQRESSDNSNNANISQLATSSPAGLFHGSGSFNYFDSYSWNALSAGSPVSYIDPGLKLAYRITACNTSGCATSWRYPASGYLGVTPAYPNDFTNHTAGAPTALTATTTSGSTEIDFQTSVPMSSKFPAYGGFWVIRALASSPSVPQYSVYVSSTQCAMGSCNYNDYDPVNHPVYPDQSYIYTLRFVESDFLCNWNRDSSLGGPQLSTSSAATIIVPSAVTNASASFNKVDTVTLFWTPPNSINENFYVIQRATDDKFTQNVINLYNTLGQGARTYNDQTNIQQYYTYYYRIWACTNSHGCSQYAQTSIRTTPASIFNLRAYIVSASSTAKKAIVRLNWDSNGGTSYTVKRDNSPVASGLTRTAYDDLNVPFNTSAYNYGVDSRVDNTSISATVNLNIQSVLNGAGWASAGTSSIRWVNFNSLGQNGGTPSKDYSVQIDNTGLMSGEAWSGQPATGGDAAYGWLSFNKDDLIGCPSASTQTAAGPPCEARYSTSTKAMSGWARFLAPKNFSAADNSAWGGWVSLNNQNPGISFNPSLSKPIAFLNSIFSPLASFVQNVLAVTNIGYGPTLANGRFSGAAWGGAVAGWLVFGTTTDANSNPICGVYCNVQIPNVNQPPVVSGVVASLSDESWCANTPSILVSWNYSDEANGPSKASQTSAKVSFVNTSTSLVDASAIISGGIGGYTFNDPLGYNATHSYNATGYLTKSSSYIVQVQASNGTTWSTTAQSSGSFPTPPYYYPLYPPAGFTWTPNPFSPPAQVTFNVSVTDRSGGTALPFNWNWQFSGANQSASTDQNPQILVQQSNAFATSTVTDSNNKGCYVGQALSGGGTVVGTPKTLKRHVFKEL